jgi:hypothetical protein
VPDDGFLVERAVRVEGDRHAVGRHLYARGPMRRPRFVPLPFLPR